MADEPMEVEPSSSNDAPPLALAEETTQNSETEHVNNADENKGSHGINQSSEKVSSKGDNDAISNVKTLDKLSPSSGIDMTPKEQDACNSSADKSENESNLHAKSKISGAQQHSEPINNTDDCSVANDSSSVQKPQTQASEVLNIAEQSISSSDGSVEDVAKQVVETEPKPDDTQMVANNNGQVIETESATVAENDSTKEPESTAGTKQDSPDDVVEAQKDGSDEEAVVESIDLAEDDVQEPGDEERSDEGIQEIHDVDDDDEEEESADAIRSQGAENATQFPGQVSLFLNQFFICTLVHSCRCKAEKKKVLLE